MDERYCPGCADPGCHTCVTIRYMAGPEYAAYHTPRLRYGETHDSYRDRRQDEEDQAWDTWAERWRRSAPYYDEEESQ